ncbi:hypothetical protein IP81_14695 [Novosphingobium sp. AAP83]|nr:hypothetical protein IP81_14695 [Novosphingobium sp. AAP83]
MLPGSLEIARGIVAAPLSPQKHVWCARIVLLSSDGLGASAIMSSTGKVPRKANVDEAHGHIPHCWRNFKLSNDPAFAAKLHDIVGRYVSPPALAVQFPAHFLPRCDARRTNSGCRLLTGPAV